MYGMLTPQFDGPHEKIPNRVGFLPIETIGDPVKKLKFRFSIDARKLNYD